MAGKSFKDNPALKFINRPATGIDSQANDTTGGAKAVEQAQPPVSSFKEQGSRINLAFTPDDFNYLQAIARQDGLSITEYLNRLISADRRNRIDEEKQRQDS